MNLSRSTTTYIGSQIIGTPGSKEKTGRGASACIFLHISNSLYSNFMPLLFFFSSSQYTPCSDCDGRQPSGRMARQTKERFLLQALLKCENCRQHCTFTLVSGQRRTFVLWLKLPLNCDYALNESRTCMLVQYEGAQSQ